MGVVVCEFKVFVLEAEDVFHLGVDLHLGQGAGLTGELQLHLLYVILVDVDVAEGVYKLSGLQACDLRHHHEQQGIGGDVEGYAEEGVGTALVELQAELAVGHVELEEGVAGGQVHVLEVAHVPCVDDDAPAVGVVPDGVDDLLYLVYVASLVVGPRAPLVAVDVSEVAIRVGPLVPDAHAVVLQVLDIGVAIEEPEQLVDDGLEVQLLGGEAGEALLEVEPHLVAKHTDGACARAVALLYTLREDAVEQV